MRKMLKKIVPVLAVLLTALFVAMPAHAAQGTITEYHQVAYGVMRVGHFEINGQMAFCTDHDKTTPPAGTAVTSSGTVTNENMRKALYYGYGGPGSVVGKNDQGWTLTSMALSLAKGTATTHNTEMISWYNEVIQRPAPPSGFVVTLWDTGRSAMQQLATWTWNPEGTVKITKKVEAPDELLRLLDGILSVEGTEFTVKDSSGSVKGTVRIAKDGTGSLTLPEGTYTVEETKAAPGLMADAVPRKVTVKSGQTAQVTFEDRPILYPAGLLLVKKGEDEKPLEGAQFEIAWYPEHFSEVKAAETRTAGRTWTFATDEEGKIFYDEAHLLEGTLFTDAGGTACLLPGTYVMRETLAPAGYAAAEPALTDLPLGNAGSPLQEFRVQEITDDLQRITIRIEKKDAVTGKVKAEGFGSFDGALFEVLRYDAIEDREISCATVRTDSEGKGEVNGLLPGIYQVREVKAPEGYLAMEKSITVRAGVKEKNTAVFVYEIEAEEQPILVQVEKLAYAADGSLSALPGAALEVRTKEGELVTSFLSQKEPFLLHALPVGEYLLRETQAPEGYLLPQEDLFFTVEEKEGIQTVTLIDEKIPKIVTDAAFDSGGKTAPAGVLTGSDRVCLEDLMPGAAYTLKMQLVERESGDAVGAPVNVMFRAEGVTMQMEVPFFVPEEAAGKNLTVTQTLIREGRVVAEHTDREDTAQMISVMRIGTSASACGGMIPGTGEAKITDEIRYEGALTGHAYTAVMTLVDPETQEPLREASGGILTQRAVFEPDAARGTVQVTLQIPEDTQRTALRYTVFEEIYEGEILVAEHRQMDAASQTLTVPKIGTVLRDEGLRKEEVFFRILKDTVRYEGLDIGKEYTVTGQLMDKTSGRPILDAEGKAVTSSATFVAQNREGEEEILFRVPENILREKTVVAFESLDHEGTVLAVHADLNDEAQTVQLPRIIGTRAAVAPINGDTVVIRDTVAYEGLTPGRTYELRAQLYDKTGKKMLTDDSGKKVIVTADFVPGEESGTQDVMILVARPLVTEKTVVVFETLFEEGCEVSSHRNEEDRDQTVRIDRVPKTGDSNVVLYAAAGCGISFSLAVLARVLLMRRRKTKTQAK